jgi:translation initiation factor IF-2
MPDTDLLPEIVIDDSNPDYVETDEEAEHSDEEPVKSRPPASEIFQSETAAAQEPPPEEPVLEVEQSSEEEPAPEPAPQLSIQPIQKPKRQASTKQREHLARIRVKAAESRKKQATERQKEQPARRSTHPTFSDDDVDRLLDRYKERRKAKKASKPAVTKPDSSTPAPAQTNADLHTVPQPLDDPWAECFL